MLVLYPGVNAMKNITNGPAYSHWKSRLLIVIGRIINKALYWTFFMLPEGSRAVAVSHILGELKLHYVKKMLPGDRNLIFFPPSFKPLHRGQTVLSIQPEVPVWIDSFLPNSTFWDIGTNIGAYTLNAGLRENINIVAFEPGSANYYVLSRNIELNSQHKRTSAYCIALSDKSTIGHLTKQQSSMGAAHNAIGDPRD